jgi:hypothetical protein
MDHQFGTHAAIDDETVVLGRHRHRSRLESNESPLDRSQPSSAEISPTKRRSRSRKLIPSVEGDKVIAERFRTKLCRNYLQHPDHPCPYEDRCMFAHGDHELRTATQNMLDGLMSEEAIREFKRKETDSARSRASLSCSSSMISSAVHVPRGFPNEPPPGDMASFQFFQDDVENANLFASSHHQAAIAGMCKVAIDSVALGSYSDASPSSDVASASSFSANATHRQSSFTQEWFMVPGKIFHEERDSANGNSVSILTYTHDPYSWRAV